jgi:hypothetical protein
LNTAAVTNESACDTLSSILRRRGALVLAVFGAVWSAAGASGLSAFGNAPTIVLAATVGVSVCAVLVAIRSGRRPAKRVRLPPGWNRQVGWVNLAELVAIGMAWALLVQAGLPQLLAPVVCLIVGLHFLPLARPFDQPLYRWTGVCLAVVAVIGFVVLAVGIDGGATRSVVGFGAAVTLWTSSFALALRG